MRYAHATWLVPARPRWLQCLAALALALCWASAVMAQAPGAPPAPQPFVPAPPGAPGAPAPGPVPRVALGDVATRFHIVLVDQFSYIQHPFFQITEDPGFAAGSATTTNVTDIGSRATDTDANFLIRALHALPPFGIEGVMGIGLPFPRGVGWGLDYSPLNQLDVDAAEGVSTIIPIQMDAYLYMAALRFYFFDPTEPGVNYFFGVGIGLLDGSIRAAPFANTPAAIIPFSQFPVSSTRIGLEGRGDTWGFRYELNILNAEEVTLESNPYPDQDGDNTAPGTIIDFSGAWVRVSIFAHF